MYTVGIFSQLVFILPILFWRKKEIMKSAKRFKYKIVPNKLTKIGK